MLGEPCFRGLITTPGEAGVTRPTLAAFTRPIELGVGDAIRWLSKGRVSTFGRLSELTSLLCPVASPPAFLPLNATGSGLGRKVGERGSEVSFGDREPASMISQEPVAADSPLARDCLSMCSGGVIGFC